MISHLLVNLRTYAAAVVLIGGAVLGADVLPDTWAKDVAVAVAIAGAVAVPAPRSVKVEPTTGPRQG